MNYIHFNIFRLLPPALSTSATRNFFLKNVHYRRRSFRVNLQNAAPNSNYHKKSTHSRVQQSMFMLLYALLISFPVRHTANFRFDGRYCIGDLMTNAVVRKLLYSQFDR